MKHSLEVCLVVLTFTGSALLVAAQSAELPKQRGISVELPVTNNAVAVPDADKEDALVVTITRDGEVYLGLHRTDITALREKVRNTLSNRSEKTLYVKADARAPYAILVRILDSVRTADVQRLTLLTAQRDSENPGTLVPPKGLEMVIVSPH